MFALPPAMDELFSLTPHRLQHELYVTGMSCHLPAPLSPHLECDCGEERVAFVWKCSVTTRGALKYLGWRQQLLVTVRYGMEEEPWEHLVINYRH